MGQTTYGKGTMQRTVAIECTSNLAPGVRLTVARVLSPSRHPYHDRGVTPHEYLDPLSIDPLTAGKLHLQTLVRMMMR
jgi:C-terminal processing protease CtpA/Prc